MAITERAVYPTQPSPLRTHITELLRKTPTEPVEGEIVAIVVPDSNLLSGSEAAARTFKTLDGRTFDSVILVAPSHTGSFQRISICSLDHYRTPLGELKVDDRLRNELCDEDDDIYLDDTGHFHTEGIDVQLPYLQTVLKAFDVVPVVMGDESPDFCRELGHAIGEVMYNRRTLLVASADIIDGSEEALEAFRATFEAGDISRLMALLNSEQVLVEGKGALLVALLAAQHRRANRFRILRLDPPEDGRPGALGAVLVRD